MTDNFRYRGCCILKPTVYTQRLLTISHGNGRPLIESNIALSGAAGSTDGGREELVEQG